MVISWSGVSPALCCLISPVHQSHTWLSSSSKSVLTSQLKRCTFWELSLFHTLHGYKLKSVQGRNFSKILRLASWLFVKMRTQRYVSFIRFCLGVSGPTWTASAIRRGYLAVGKGGFKVLFGFVHQQSIEPFLVTDWLIPFGFYLFLLLLVTKRSWLSALVLCVCYL